jgi:hypothetical protein
VSPEAMNNYTHILGLEERTCLTFIGRKRENEAGKKLYGN